MSPGSSPGTRTGDRRPPATPPRARRAVRTTLSLVLGAVGWLGAGTAVGCGGGAGATGAPTAAGASPDGAPEGPAGGGSTDAAGAQDADGDAAPEVVGGGRPLDADEERALASMVRRTERVRGLTFQAPVAVEVESRQTITQRFLSDFDEEALEHARLAYVALGLLDPELDLRGLLARVLGEQVVGYYDTKQDRLVIREDVMGWLSRRSGRTGALDARRRDAHLVILHELVHALQDQHFDLDALESDDLASDVGLARRSLVEGDATLAILAYSLELVRRPLSSVTQSRTGLDRLLALAEEAGDPEGDDQALAEAPPIIRGALLAPYVDGTRFAGHLHGRHGWRGIDEGFARPPASMEQVLHPDAYERREGPDRVEVPILEALTDAGLRRLDDDTLGELELSYFFGLGLPEADRDREAAAGWGGDRLAVYRPREDGGRPVAVWFTAWDSEAEAVEAALAATQALQASPTPGASDGSDQRVRRRGRAVLILRQLPPALQPAVIDAFDAFAESLPAPRDRPVPRLTPSGGRAR